jgi:hypothetical protein
MAARRTVGPGVAGVVRLLAPLSLPLATLLACKGSAGSVSSADGGASAADDSPCAQYYDATVAYETACTPAALAFPLPRDRTIHNCELLVATPDLADGAGDITRCAQARRDATTTCAPLRACVFSPGLRADGASCGTDAQCASTYCRGSGVSTNGEVCGACAQRVADGAACDPKSPACAVTSACIPASGGKTATCMAVVVVDLGGPCDTTHLCGGGAFCDGTTKKCVARADLGAACSIVTDCKTGLACSQKVCVTAKKAGESCSVDANDNTDCLQGLYCDTTSGTCMQPVVGASGAACDDIKVVCEGSCEFSSAGGGKCQTIVADGAPCNATTSSEACDTYAYCMVGTCAYYDPAACK